MAGIHVLTPQEGNTHQDTLHVVFAFKPRSCGNQDLAKMATKALLQGQEQRQMADQLDLLKSHAMLDVTKYTPIFS